MRIHRLTLLILCIAATANAQWLDRKTPGVPRKADGSPNLLAPAPRTPDGKPDLSGVWNGANVVARPDPANLKPSVLDKARQSQQEYFKTRPYYQCLPSGPEAERFGGWKRILQTPTEIAILNDDLTYRVIFMDGRQLEKNMAGSFMGYSVGRWEGDTLVVDSVGFNDKTWTSRYGITHTESLRTTERYRRTDFGHMQIEVTYTDPESYLKPWGFKADMELAADTEMLEQVCERSSEHWSSSSSQTVTVARDVLARYVGTYSGIYGGNKRTINVTLAGDQLMVKIVGAADIEGGLGTAGLNPDDPQPLLPRSDTLFEGFGLGFQFVVDDRGNPTDLIEIHISGPYKFPRER